MICVAGCLIFGVTDATNLIVVNTAMIARGAQVKEIIAGIVFARWPGK